MNEFASGTLTYPDNWVITNELGSKGGQLQQDSEIPRSKELHCAEKGMEKVKINDQKPRNFDNERY